jgi:hypothetical protein
MNLYEYYKVIKDIIQMERKEISFPSHLNMLLDAYMVSCSDLDDSFFMDGAVGKATLLNEIQKVCDGIGECFDLILVLVLKECER